MKDIRTICVYHWIAVIQCNRVVVVVVVVVVVLVVVVVVVVV